MIHWSKRILRYTIVHHNVLLIPISLCIAVAFGFVWIERCVTGSWPSADMNEAKGFLAFLVYGFSALSVLFIAAYFLFDEIDKSRIIRGTVVNPGIGFLGALAAAAYSLYMFFVAFRALIR